MAGKGRPFTTGDPRINKKGRPKKGTRISDKFEDMLNEVLDPLTGYTVLDSMMDAVKKKALQGDLPSLEYVIARAYGKMVERVESNNKNVNENYDLSDRPLDERKMVWEILKRGKRPDTDKPIN